MEILIKVLQFVLSFTLLVFIHEFGHFIFSRIFGVRVEKFYIFFNPWFSLFKYKKGETEYGIGWLPLGGFCKISGMIDESMDTEQMAQPAQPYEFRSKPAWQRLLIMIGGVLMNVVLAVCIYIGMSYAFGDKYLSNHDVQYGYVFSEVGKDMGFMNGDKIMSINGKPVDDMSNIFKTILLDAPVDVEIHRTMHGDGSMCSHAHGHNHIITIDDTHTAALLKEQKTFLEPRSEFVIDQVFENAGAINAGLQKGDKVIAINGKSMLFSDEITAVLKEHKSDSVLMRVFRPASENGNAPKMMDVNVAVSAVGMIGVSVQPFMASMPMRSHNYTFFEAIPAGFKRTGHEISAYWKQIKMIFKPKTEAYKSLGGMIAIGRIFPSYWNWETFWSITAFLSIVLAVMNILPLPALDGGHVLFLIAEIIMGRAPSDKFMEYAQRVGLILLFILLIYANGNDIYRFIIK